MVWASCGSGSCLGKRGAPVAPAGERAGRADRRRGRTPRQRAVDGGKGAIDEDIAVVRFGIANPHERHYRLDLAAPEEGGANAEDGVAVAGDRPFASRS